MNEHRHGDSPSAASPPGAPPAVVKDPVCGMTVDPRTAKHRAEHGGKTYYFCSAGCRAKFEADPLRYVPASTAATGRADQEAGGRGDGHDHTNQEHHAH